MAYVFAQNAYFLKHIRLDVDIRVLVVSRFKAKTIGLVVDALQ